MLKQQDAVGLILFDDQIRENIPARAKRSHLNVSLSKMENISAGPETHIAPVLHQTAEVIKKRGLIILISDLFDSPEEVLSGLKHFRYHIVALSLILELLWHRYLRLPLGHGDPSTWKRSLCPSYSRPDAMNRRTS